MNEQTEEVTLVLTSPPQEKKMSLTFRAFQRSVTIMGHPTYHQQQVNRQTIRMQEIHLQHKIQDVQINQHPQQGKEAMSVVVQHLQKNIS